MSINKSVSVVILTNNEESNLPNCLSSLQGLDANVYVVDSGSTDGTIEIAEEAGCRVYYHEFKNYGAQRNWTFENLPLDTPWTLCLDADERLTPALVKEINHEVQKKENKFDGFMISCRTLFMGKWIKYGGQYPSFNVRLFKTGFGRSEAREYDQHFILKTDKLGKLKNDYIDSICSDLTTWSHRHVAWAEKEVQELIKFSKDDKGQVKAKFLGNPIERKRFLRSKIYQRSPILLRAFLFWFYVYFVRLGFLDKKAGLIFHTLRCFWWRFLVDAKVHELSQNENNK